MSEDLEEWRAIVEAAVAWRRGELRLEHERNRAAGQTFRQATERLRLLVDEYLLRGPEEASRLAGGG